MSMTQIILINLDKPSPPTHYNYDCSKTLELASAVGRESYVACSISSSEVQSEGRVINCDKMRTVDYTPQHQVTCSSCIRL